MAKIKKIKLNNNIYDLTDAAALHSNNVDSSISTESTSTNVPTSEAVAYLVSSEIDSFGDSLEDVAFSGNYNDLKNLPDFPEGTVDLSLTSTSISDGTITFSVDTIDNDEIDLLF